MYFSYFRINIIDANMFDGKRMRNICKNNLQLDYFVQGAIHCKVRHARWSAIGVILHITCPILRRSDAILHHSDAIGKLSDADGTSGVAI